METLYFDHNATTPLDERVFDAMLPYLREHYGNPSSIHAPGRRTRAAIDDARDRAAAILRARPHEITFTSGGTESDNLALLGIARRLASRGKHLITVATEHHAVLNPLEWLAAREGFRVTILPVLPCGRLDPESLRAAITPETTLVSVMTANNETGVRHPIAEIGALCRENGVFFHSDAIQSFGKEPLDRELFDAISLAAHKFGGPKGAGLLWLRSGHTIDPVQHGGTHENQRRAGTENTAAIVGLACAMELACGGSVASLDPLREALWEGISHAYPAAIRHGNREETLANTLSVSFPGLDGESLLIALDLAGVAASSGSACMVGSIQPSHVLLAMGVPPEVAQATVRLSLGKEHTLEHIEEALCRIKPILQRLSAAD